MEVGVKYRAIAFSVDGVPKGQPRPRATARGGKAQVYDPGTAEAWKAQIAFAIRPYLPPEPIDGPLYVSAVFLMPRPKRLLTKSSLDGLIPHTAKPDCDNLAKALYDCLTQVGVWRDDAQIVYARVQKYYCEKHGRPGASIVIDEWRND